MFNNKQQQIRMKFLIFFNQTNYGGGLGTYYGICVFYVPMNIIYTIEYSIEVWK